MATLNTQGLASGFLDGFQVMGNHMQRQRENELKDEDRQVAAQQLERENQLQDEDRQIAKTQRERDNQFQDEERQIAKTQREQQNKTDTLNRELMQKQAKVASQTYDIQSQEHNWAKRDQLRKELQPKLKAHFERFGQTGRYDSELMQQAREAGLETMDPFYWLDEKVRHRNLALHQGLTEAKQGNIGYFNSEPGLKALNGAYQDQLGEGKRIVGFKLIPDGKKEPRIAVQLEVQTPEGSYQTSLTKYRSAHPDDPVSLPSAQAIFDDMAGRVIVAGSYEQLLQDPQVAQQLQSAYQSLYGGAAKPMSEGYIQWGGRPVLYRDVMATMPSIKDEQGNTVPVFKESQWRWTQGEPLRDEVLHRNPMASPQELEKLYQQMIRSQPNQPQPSEPQPPQDAPPSREAQIAEQLRRGNRDNVPYTAQAEKGSAPGLTDVGLLGMDLDYQ